MYSLICKQCIKPAAAQAILNTNNKYEMNNLFYVIVIY